MKDKKRKFSKDISSERLLGKKEKVFEILLIVILLSFGIYQSFLYWGHQPVPHFDFNCFAQTGHEILNFQNPSSYKRAPLVGVFQVLLGKITGGLSPDFRGGWLLNALLNPLNGVFVFLIARRIVGRAAFWIALLTILNPWLVQILTEAITETALLFSFLITFYFIVKRSKWCYLFAAISTMVRYEGAGLIFVAFLVDVIEAKNNRERMAVLIYSALASVPLGLWMLGTFLDWHTQRGSHYLTELGEQSGGKILFVKYLQITWQVAFGSLLMLPMGSSAQSFKLVFLLSKIIVAISFIIGVVYAALRKNWSVLAMVVFLILYLLVHAIHSWAYQRFCVPIVWIPLLICCLGLKELWSLINKDNRLGSLIPVMLQAVLIILALCLILEIYRFLPQTQNVSRRSYYLPYIAGVLALFVFVGRIYIFGRRYTLREIAVVSFMILMIMSNHFTVAGVVGNGQRDIEFKYLLDWYLANARPGEKMVLTVPVILQTMAPTFKDCFIHTNTFDANTPQEFVQECYKKNITYVAWDSRMGLCPGDRYYKWWKMSNIAPLAAGRDIGPYQFVTQLKANQRRYVNVYRLMLPFIGR